MKLLQMAAFMLLFVFVPTVQAQDSLENLAYIKGKWTVTTAFYEEGKLGPVSEPDRAAADTVLGGSFIRIDAPVSFPGGTFLFEMTLSYDQFHQVYRLAFLDDLNGYMDVYEGTMNEGVLSVNNADTGSNFPDGNGGVVIGKLEFTKTEDGFLVTSYIASQKEGPYSPYMRLTFTAAQ
jgi:hypothetical protein